MKMDMLDFNLIKMNIADIIKQNFQLYFFNFKTFDYDWFSETMYYFAVIKSKDLAFYLSEYSDGGQLYLQCFKNKIRFYEKNHETMNEVILSIQQILDNNE